MNVQAVATTGYRDAPASGRFYKRLGDACNRTRLKPWIKRLFERYLGWRR